MFDPLQGDNGQNTCRGHCQYVDNDGESRRRSAKARSMRIMSVTVPLTSEASLLWGLLTVCWIRLTHPAASALRAAARPAPGKGVTSVKLR